MRGFMWQKIPVKSVPDSIWINIDDEKLQFNQKELEDIFGVDPDEGKKQVMMTEEDPTSLKASISLLDPKRSNNVEIMLRGLKMNHIEIKNALMNMDSNPETGLSPDKLKAIQINLPTPEELSLIENYDGDKDELGNAERYFMQISKIPMLDMRVNSLEYKSSFDSKCKELEQSLDSLQEAIKIIKTDQRFHSILAILLGLGNYLNGGTNRGQTHGFKIQSLAKLADVRSPKNPSITLLHYFADLLATQYKDLYQTLKEFHPVHAATRESSTEVTKSLTHLSSGIIPIQNQLESSDCDTAYSKSMSEWLKSAQSKLLELQSKDGKVQEGIKDILVLFAEPTNTKSEDFFQILSSFATGIEQAYITNEKRKAAESARDKKNLGVSITPNKNQTPRPSTDPTPQEVGEFDRLLAKMKNGGAFLDRKSQ